MMRVPHLDLCLILFIGMLFAVPSNPLYAQTSNGTVNLLYEAESYTPPLYRGRPLPSASVPIRIYADAHLFSAKGNPVAPQNIVYTWSVNGRVVQSISGVGQNYITLPGPALFGALIVGVEAAAGGIAASETVRIGAEEPILGLYENNSLTGLSLRNALGGSSALSSRKTTIVAEPYFFSSPNKSSDIRYTWRINNSPAAADPTGPYTITLSATSSNTLLVSLSATHALRTLQTTKRTWQLLFTNSSNSQFTQ